VLVGELEQLRADTASEIAAVKQQTADAEARAKERAVEVTRVRTEAQAFVDDAARLRDQARGDAEEARRQAEATEAAAARFLGIPIPPAKVRAQVRHIENALTVLHQLGYVLEVGMTEEVESQIPLDLEMVRSLVWTVQGQARDLSRDLDDLPTQLEEQAEAEAAAEYARTAVGAYRAFLKRIEDAAEGLRNRDRSPDAEVVEAVTTMLADQPVRELRELPH
jgi:colicin import membrane protein